MALETFCRLCLKIAENEQVEFTKVNGNADFLINLHQTFSICEQITNVYNDICHECFNKVVHFNEFKQLVENNDLLLKKKCKILKAEVEFLPKIEKESEYLNKKYKVNYEKDYGNESMKCKTTESVLQDNLLLQDEEDLYIPIGEDIFMEREEINGNILNTSKRKREDNEVEESVTYRRRQNVFICELCLKVCNNKKHIRKHKKQHRLCRICNTKFPSFYCLKAHICKRSPVACIRLHKIDQQYETVHKYKSVFEEYFKKFKITNSILHQANDIYSIKPIFVAEDSIKREMTSPIKADLQNSKTIVDSHQGPQDTVNNLKKKNDKRITQKIQINSKANDLHRFKRISIHFKEDCILDATIKSNKIEASKKENMFNWSNLPVEPNLKIPFAFESVCICQKDLNDSLIFCENAQCKVVVYHLSCVRLKKIPRNTWYCSACRLDNCDL